MPTNVVFLKIDEVVRVTKKSRTALYRDINNGEFPAPIKIGARASAWLASDVANWQESRIKAARKE